jgi:NAD(P) transhydrogenase subunit alpha
MKIGVPTEVAPDETRVALIPPVAKRLIGQGHEILVATGAGEASDWSDEEYESVGCSVAPEDEVYADADVVVHVRALGAVEDADASRYADGQVVVGLLNPYGLDDADFEALAERDVSAYALELVPRIGRAQSMDANSSMASIGGYKATIVAAESLPKLFPMQMTAAGTVQPADVFVVGAGVAGLQAIATSERLGASTRAYDIRPEVKEEVESLGAEFVELDLPVADEASDEQGYAVEQEEEFLETQREMMVDVVGDSDVVVTTAAVPGGNAPELVTNEMIDGMDEGSVIVDMAAAGGGNCEPTVADEVVEYEGVTVYGPTNLPATVPHTASQLYANNVEDFLGLLAEDGELDAGTEDEILDATALTHGGRVRAPHRDDGDGADEDGDDAEADGDGSEGDSDDNGGADDDEVAE